MRQGGVAAKATSWMLILLGFIGFNRRRLTPTTPHNVTTPQFPI